MFDHLKNKKIKTQMWRTYLFLFCTSIDFGQINDVLVCNIEFYLVCLLLYNFCRCFMFNDDQWVLVGIKCSYCLKLIFNQCRSRHVIIVIIHLYLCIKMIHHFLCLTGAPPDLTPHWLHICHILLLLVNPERVNFGSRGFTGLFKD